MKMFLLWLRITKIQQYLETESIFLSNENEFPSNSGNCVANCGPKLWCQKMSKMGSKVLWRGTEEAPSKTHLIPLIVMLEICYWKLIKLEPGIVLSRLLLWMAQSPRWGHTIRSLTPLSEWDYMMFFSGQEGLRVAEGHWDILGSPDWKAGRIVKKVKVMVLGTLWFSKCGHWERSWLMGRGELPYLGFRVAEDGRFCCLDLDLTGRAQRNTRKPEHPGLVSSSGFLSRS